MDFHPLILALDPPIEDIAAKWASLAIFRIIDRAEEQFERVQIQYQLELLCRKSGIEYSSLNFASWSIGQDFLGSSDQRFRRSSRVFSMQRSRHVFGVFKDHL